MKTDPATGVLVPFDFRGIYDEFPAIRSLQVRIDVQSLTPVIDSSNVTPALWLHLAELIRDNYARYDGFVVLHGTDTMSYTASALSFLLENLAKPVVFTGSQIPIGVLRTDGRENLITAIEIAAAHDAEGPLVPEVSLYFQNRLFRANRTVKQSAEEFARIPLLQLSGAGRSGRQYHLPPRLHPPPGTRRRRTPGRRSIGRPRAGHPPFSRSARTGAPRHALDRRAAGRSAGNLRRRATPPRHRNSSAPCAKPSHGACSS